MAQNLAAAASLSLLVFVEWCVMQAKRYSMHIVTRGSGGAHPYVSRETRTCWAAADWFGLIISSVRCDFFLAGLAVCFVEKTRPCAYRLCDSRKVSQHLVRNIIANGDIIRVARHACVMHDMIRGSTVGREAVHSTDHEIGCRSQPLHFLMASRPSSTPSAFLASLREGHRMHPCAL